MSHCRLEQRYRVRYYEWPTWVRVRAAPHKLPRTLTKGETMHASAARRTEYSAERALYLVFDLGNRAWKPGFTTGLGQTTWLRTIGAGDPAKLQEELRAVKERFGLPEKARF